jgi:hypothetical protein
MINTSIFRKSYSLIQEKTKRRLRAGQNLLPSRLSSKKLKITIFKTTILPMVVYGSETCSLKLRKELRMTEFHKRMLRRLFVLKMLVGQNCIKMKNGVFWVVTPCGSCKNRHLGGTWRLLQQGDKNR